MRALAVPLSLLLLGGCLAPGSAPPTATWTAPPGTGGGNATLGLTKLVDGLSKPVFLAEDPSLHRLWIAEQTGRILTTPRDDPGKTDVLLDLAAQTRGGGERGLLGFALHPDFGIEDQRFYVDFTDLQGDTQVDEYRFLGQYGSPGALPLKTRRLLTVEQPYPNHNGGMLAFGPDRMLYVGLGDGGSGGDPHGNGQDKQTLLGKILRIDVGTPSDASAGRPYSIPPDNPFAQGGGRGEIWDYGLRNPWRFGFDPKTGDLWIADVGQGQWEEVNLEAAGRGGNNYGWDAYEGTHPFDTGVRAPGAVMPVAEYDHGGGRCSITGGYVHRGASIPSLDGAYLYADYCSGTLWALTQEAGRWAPRVLLETGFMVSSFGQDLSGEVYVLDHGGAVHRLVQT